MGIEQLVDTFKGNPQPLAQKVQKDQQGQPPGAIPPDLEEAMALQKISELRNGAQAQQSMQAGGAQPSVVEKLRQMLGSMQQQSQPQAGQPVMAASGGSLAQLMSNLGQNYAGGGIVAFSGPDGSKVEDDTDVPEWARGLRAERLAKQKALDEARARNMAMVNTRDEDMRPVMPNDPRLLRVPVEESVSAAPMPVSSASTSPAPAAKPGLPQAPVAPQTPASVAPQKVDPNSLRTLVEGYARKEMGLNPDVERQNAVDWSKKTMGIDNLMQEREGRIAAREQAIKEAKENRTPEWIKTLQSAGGAPVRGGIGMLLGRMGAAATSNREANTAQDLAYQSELDHLRDVITDAKLKGNMELAKEGMAAYKEVDARKRSAATNATGLLENDERIAQRKADTAARLAASAGNAPLKATNAAENAYDHDIEAQTIKKQLESPMYTMGGADPAPLIAKLQKIRASKYAQLKIKMEDDTGASQASSGSSLKYNPKTGKIE